MPNTVLLIKDQRACQRCRRCETLYSNTNKGSKGYVCWRCQKWCLWLLHNSIYRLILLMLEVSKLDRELSIQSNITHVKGIESGSINTIKAVMLCMSKVSKEVQNGLTHLCS